MKTRLDECDNKIILLAHQNNGISISELSQKLYLTEDAIRRRANRLVKEGYLDCQKIKTDKPSPPIHIFHVTSESVIKMLDKSSLNGSQPLFSFVQSLSESTIFAFFAVLLVGKVTSPELGEILEITPQAARYHLDILNASSDLMFRLKRSDLSTSYHYFIASKFNPEILLLAVEETGNIKRRVEIEKQADLLRQENNSKIDWIKNEINGLNPAAQKLIKAIYWHHGLTNKILAEKIDESHDNVGYHAGRLEQKGLVARIIDPLNKMDRYLNYPMFQLSIDAYQTIFGDYPKFLWSAKEHQNAPASTLYQEQELERLPQEPKSINSTANNDSAVSLPKQLQIENKESTQGSCTHSVEIIDKPSNHKALSDFKNIVDMARSCLAAKERYEDSKQLITEKYCHMCEEYGDDFKQLFESLFSLSKF